MSELLGKTHLLWDLAPLGVLALVLLVLVWAATRNDHDAGTIGTPQQFWDTRLDDPDSPGDDA